MKKFAYATTVYLFAATAAAAGDNALCSLLSAKAAPAAVPAASAPAPVPDRDADRALASDVLDLSPNYADFLAGYALASGYAVFELDGARMTSKDALMAHSAKMLRLPGLPENWDALIDYLYELPSIHHNNRVLIVVRNSSKIRLADPDLYADFREVAEFACKNAREWSRNKVTMKFAFVQ